MDDTTRRNLALFPIGIVQKLTDLTARQIRYYEQHELIHPQRTEGNQRLFSFNDVERLLEIKNLIDKGLNIAGIKTVISQGGLFGTPTTVPVSEAVELSERELHDLLLQELADRAGQRGGPAMTIQGELSRFFHRDRSV
ncbi:MAG: MerR family transcriptional regulator [Firmicutes bacterium]|nr:MerR family transcriptional regulator [Bacillota bacterium]